MEHLIPHPSCPQLLEKVLDSKYRMLNDLRQHDKYRILASQDALAVAVALCEAAPDTLPEYNRELRDYFLTVSCFAKDRIRALLDDLLAADSHLKSCCRNATGLARAIEIVSPSASTPTAQWNTGGKGAIIGSILARLFECPYQRETFVHLYNLRVGPVPVRLPDVDADIVQLDVQDIPRLTGEVTFVSALHDPRTGTGFVRFTDKGFADEQQVFENYWNTSWLVLRVLRFAQYGVVDMDYGGFLYRPEWVNQVLRFGIHFWGQPRRDVQPSPYVLDGDSLERFIRYWKTFLRIRPILEDIRSGLRQSTALAGNFFESHYRRISREERLIELVIALEVMFSPSREGELRFRIAQRAAILLGKHSEERLAIATFMKRIYDGRSTLVHSGKSPFAEDQLTDGDIPQLGDYVRQAILRLVTLQIQGGYTDKQSVQTLLDECALDASRQDVLMKSTDFERAVAEWLA